MKYARPVMVVAIILLLAIAIAAPVTANDNKSLKEQNAKLEYQLATYEQEFHELGYWRGEDGHWYPDSGLGMVCEDCGADFAKSPYGEHEYEYCPCCGSYNIREGHDECVNE